MEYSLRNKNALPMSPRQKRMLNRTLKPTELIVAKSSPVKSPLRKSKVSGVANESSRANTDFENSESLTVSKKEDTIGNRLSRRSSTSRNLKGETLSKCKEKAERKSCVADTVTKAEKSEESTVKVIPSNNANAPVVESISENEVDGDVCEKQANVGDSASKSKGRRVRKSLVHRVTIPDSIVEEYPRELSSETSKHTVSNDEVGQDLIKAQPIVDDSSSEGKGKSLRKSSRTTAPSGDSISNGERGLQEDTAGVVTRRRLGRESKECEQAWKPKLVRSNKKGKESEASNIVGQVLCETEVNNLLEKNTILSPNQAFINVSSSTQTKTNFFCVSSQEVADSVDVREKSSQTSYISFCRAEGTQCSVDLKTKSTQTSTEEMVNKGTSMEDFNPSQECDLMVLMLEAVKKLKESAIELSISSIAETQIKNPLSEAETIIPVGKKSRESCREMNQQSGSSKKKKLDKEKNAGISLSIPFHSGVDPIPSTLSSTSEAPKLDDSMKSHISSQKVRYSHSAGECTLKNCEQVTEGKTENRKLKRRSGKEAGKLCTKVPLLGSSDRVSDDKVCSASSDSVLRDGTESVDNPLQSPSNEKEDVAVSSKVSEVTDVMISKDTRRSSFNRKAEGSETLKLAEQMTGETCKRSLSPVKTDKLVSSKPNKMERTSSPVVEGQSLKKCGKSFSENETAVVESSASDRDLTTDVFVKPDSFNPKKEKRLSGRGISISPIRADKIGNTSKLSPPISRRILRHQRKSGPSPVASPEFRRKSAGEKDLKGRAENITRRGAVNVKPKDPPEEEVPATPDSSTVDETELESKEEMYNYSRDDDDDVLSLYPESEYAEMFGSFENQASYASDSFIEDKCPSPSVDAEQHIKDIDMSPVMDKSYILSTTESIKIKNKKENEVNLNSKNVTLEKTFPRTEDDIHESDTFNMQEVKNVNDELLSVNDVGLEVNETHQDACTVSTKQNLDSKNDAHTEVSGCADLNLNPCKDKVLNLKSSCKQGSKIEEIPDEVKIKVESDDALTRQEKENFESVNGSMVADPDRNSACDKEQKSYSTSTTSSPSKTVSEADESLQVPGEVKQHLPPIFKGVCFRYMKGLRCGCYKYMHNLPAHIMTMMENMGSADVLGVLLFAVNRRLDRFLDNYATACASIIASHKEGDLISSFLMAYIKRHKGNAQFWIKILRLMLECGNCCESTSVEVIKCIEKNTFSDKFLPEQMYYSLLEKMILLACEFKNINNICKVLDSLNYRGILLQDCTVKKLLKLLSSATTDADTDRLSYSIASVLVAANIRTFPQEDEILFRNMTKGLKRNGHEGLVKELSCKLSLVSDDSKSHKGLDTTQLVKATDKSRNVTPVKPNPCQTSGPSSLRKGLKRMPQTEADMHVPYKRERISRGPLTAENDLLWQQRSSDVYPPHVENQNVNVSMRQSTSYMSDRSSIPDLRSLPLDNYILNARDEEAALGIPLCHGSGPLPPSLSSDRDVSLNRNFPSCSTEPSPRFWQASAKKEYPSDRKQSYPHRSSGRAPLLPDPVFSPCGRQGFSKFADSPAGNAPLLPDPVFPPCGKKGFSKFADSPAGNAPLLPDPVFPPCGKKGFSKFADSPAGNLQFRSCGSPVMRNTPCHKASSEDTSGSLMDHNIDQSSSSSAISLSHLQRMPDSTSENFLEETFISSKWSPNIVLKAFSPWLDSCKGQVQLSKLSCKILEQDYKMAEFSLKSLLHCLKSPSLKSNKKFSDIHKVVSAVTFNLILGLVMGDAWTDAYKFLRIASSAYLPLIHSEAFFQEEMSISRKILVLSEICFRVNAMDEAIGYLNKGNLLAPVIYWKYAHLDGDVEIQVTFLTSLLGRLASGGFSETAPSIFLTIYDAQNDLYHPIDLSIHANKVILCALNGSCIKQAYDVYCKVASFVTLPKTTLRALVIGLVSEKKYSVAINLFSQVSELGVYPDLKENETFHEVNIYSYWQKEEIFLILRNAIWIMYNYGMNSNHFKDLEMIIHIKVTDSPEDVSVAWNPLMKDDNYCDEDTQELIPHCLALISNSLEEAHERVCSVLENMFRPSIRYDVIIIKEELEEVITLHPDSLQDYINERFICGRS